MEPISLMKTTTGVVGGAEIGISEGAPGVGIRVVGILVRTGEVGFVDPEALGELDGLSVKIAELGKFVSVVVGIKPSLGEFVSSSVGAMPLGELVSVGIGSESLGEFVSSSVGAMPLGELVSVGIGSESLGEFVSSGVGAMPLGELVSVGIGSESLGEFVSSGVGAMPLGELVGVCVGTKPLGKLVTGCCFVGAGLESGVGLLLGAYVGVCIGLLVFATGEYTGLSSDGGMEWVGS
jgi:hypothetical protein